MRSYHVIIPYVSPSLAKPRVRCQSNHNIQPIDPIPFSVTSGCLKPLSSTIHHARNRTSKHSRGCQRLASRGLVNIGATATPLWTSPFDVIGECQALGHGKVATFNPKNFVPSEDNEEGWVKDLDQSWAKLSRQRAERETKAKEARDQEMLDKPVPDDTEEAVPAIKEIFDKQTRAAKWLGEKEDEADAQTQANLEDVRARNEWKRKLRQEVARPLLHHLGPFIVPPPKTAGTSTS